MSFGEKMAAGQPVCSASPNGKKSRAPLDGLVDRMNRQHAELEGAKGQISGLQDTLENEVAVNRVLAGKLRDEARRRQRAAEIIDEQTRALQGLKAMLEDALAGEPEATVVGDFSLAERAHALIRRLKEERQPVLVQGAVDVKVQVEYDPSRGDADAQAARLGELLRQSLARSFALAAAR